MEWGALFAFALFVDVAQWLLDNVAVIGLALNWLIDICMGAFLAFYFWYRGVKPTISKGLFQIAMTAVETAGDGELPFWWLDVAVMFLFDKADRKIEQLTNKIPFANKAAKLLDKSS
jgi:hypothetical protein